MWKGQCRGAGARRAAHVEFSVLSDERVRACNFLVQPEFCLVSLVELILFRRSSKGGRAKCVINGCPDLVVETLGQVGPLGEVSWGAITCPVLANRLQRMSKSAICVTVALSQCAPIRFDRA